MSERFVMTAEQREMAFHALGRPTRGWWPYRNHYVCDRDTPDGQLWMALVDAGLARVRNRGELSGGMDCFWLTADGIAATLAPTEKETRA